MINVVINKGLIVAGALSYASVMEELTAAASGIRLVNNLVVAV